MKFKVPTGKRASSTRHLRLEALESRVVPSYAITELSLTAPKSNNNSLTLGPDGNIWYAREDIRLSGPNSAAWTTMIDRVGVDGTITEFNGPPDRVAYGAGSRITAGPDGNLWITERDNNAVGRITPSGNLQSFNLQETPYSLTTGPDHNLWFTSFLADHPQPAWSFTEVIRPPLPGKWVISRFVPPSDANPNGIITDFSAGLSGTPTEIINGPDGNLWFPESDVSKVGRITPAGTVTEFPLSININSGYVVLTAGPDGNIWYSAWAENTIGRITPAGVVTKFAIPTADAGPLGITAGPDGNLWFTEGNANKIGRITPTGVFLDELTVPTPRSYPDQITTGPGGSLIFTEDNSFMLRDVIGLIGEAQPANIVPNDASPGSISGTVFQSRGPYGQVNFVADMGPQPTVQNSPMHHDEPGLAGRPVYLDFTNGAGEPRERSATTDTAGNYSFSALAPGNYTLRQPASAEFSKDGPDAGFGIRLDAGANLTGVNFADRAVGAVVPAHLVQSLVSHSPSPDAQTAFVRDQYFAVLGRDADATGLGFYVGKLNAGTSRDQITQALWYSDEHRTAQVDAYYQALLQRAGDAAGRAYWVKLLENQSQPDDLQQPPGVTAAGEESVVAGFLTSKEYLALHPTDEAYVKALYNDLLGREGEASGVSYWLNALKTETRDVVAAGFLRSQESFGIAVDSYYVNYLQRLATGPEAQYWLGQYAANQQALADVALRFLKSDEFYGNARQTVV